MKKTERGRVVYNRKLHDFTLTDVARIMRKVHRPYVKPSKRAEVIVSMANFFVWLISELSANYVDEIIDELIAREGARVVKELFEYLRKKSDRVWGIVFTILEYLFKPAKK